MDNSLHILLLERRLINEGGLISGFLGGVRRLHRRVSNLKSLSDESKKAEAELKNQEKPKEQEPQAETKPPIKKPPKVAGRKVIRRKIKIPKRGEQKQQVAAFSESLIRLS